MEETLPTTIEHPSRLASRTIIVAAWLWLLAVIPFFSYAACFIFLWFFFIIAGVILGGSWITLTFIQPSLLRRPRVWCWLSVPIAGALGVALAFTDRDLALRVALSEPSLKKYVSEVPVGADESFESQRIGLFHIHEVREHQGGVYLTTSQSFIDSHGVAYIPEGTPLARECESITCMGHGTILPGTSNS
jgi:hypothetical protein